MDIPIYIDDRQEGTLTVGREGSITVFDARLRDMGRLVRLSVFGDREAYLGVPAPDGEGGMRLVRRLTPSQMRAFPSRPSYAAEKRRRAPGASAPKPEEKETAPRHVLWQGGRPYYF